MTRGYAPEAVLIAFDVLAIDGKDLRQKPLAERQTALARLLTGAPPGLEWGGHITDDGGALLRHACDLGLEGIVAKRRDSPYRSGRQEAWLKVKCTKVEPFAVTGYDPEGRHGVRSLKIARLDDACKLCSAGWAGSGPTRETGGKTAAPWMPRCHRWLMASTAA